MAVKAFWLILLSQRAVQKDMLSLPLPANLVLLSSRLFDEGFLTSQYANTEVIDEPGDYTVNGLAIQGISMAHDRLGGRRFGNNVAWAWTQAGVRGGAFRRSRCAHYR